VVALTGFWRPAASGFERLQQFPAPPRRPLLNSLRYLQEGVVIGLAGVAAYKVSW
jgi:hypothetical protein